MRRKTFAVGTIAVLAGLLAMAAFAQNRMQHQAAPQQAISHVNAAETIELKGTATSVNMAPGQGMPSMTLNVGGTAVTVILGPYRLLADNKIQITTGQEYTVKAFPDPRIANAYVATAIWNQEAGDWITLRDAAGMPHAGAGGMGMMNGRRGMGAMSGGDPAQVPHAMRGMGGMRGMHAMGDCPTCGNLDLKTLTTLSGVAQNVSIEAGQGFPNFTLSAGDGKTCTVMAGPYWLLQQNGFAIANGDSLVVTAYPSLQQAGVYAAVEIQNQTTKRAVKLRGEDGLPLVMGGRGPMHAIRK